MSIGKERREAAQRIWKVISDMVWLKQEGRERIRETLGIEKKLKKNVLKKGRLTEKS